MHLRGFPLSWLSASAFILIGALFSPLSAQTVRPFVHERDVPVPIPYFGRVTFMWSGHFLLDLQDDRTSAPLLLVVHEGGSVERISLDIAGASDVSAESYAAGADGSLAISGGASGPGPRGATYIAWISPDRKQRVVTRIWPYVAEKIAIASDGTIWAAGALKRDDNLGEVAYDLVRRFDTSGKMLSSIQAKPWRTWQNMRGAESASHLLASRDRVGWFTNGTSTSSSRSPVRSWPAYDGPCRQRQPHLA